jgi:hypothetical protein
MTTIPLLREQESVRTQLTGPGQSVQGYREGHTPRTEKRLCVTAHAPSAARANAEALLRIQRELGLKLALGWPPRSDAARMQQPTHCKNS